MHIVILVIMIHEVSGMAWNLLGGYCGQVSFGHAAFFGVGAYTAWYSTPSWDYRPVVGILSVFPSSEPSHL